MLLINSPSSLDNHDGFKMHKSFFIFKIQPAFFFNSAMQHVNVKKKKVFVKLMQSFMSNEIAKMKCT